MNRIRLLILAVSAFSVASAQQLSFNNKHVLISLEGQGALPLFANLTSDKLYSSAGNRTWLWMDAAGSATIGFFGKSTSMAAFEYSYRRYGFDVVRGSEVNRHYTNDAGNIVDEYRAVKSHPGQVYEQNFALKAIFAPIDGVLPMGLSGEFGVGYSMIRIDETVSPTISDSTVSPALQYDPRGIDLRGMTVFYGNKISFPINKSMLFSVGFRYAYNPVFGKKKFREMGEQTEYWQDPYELWRAVHHRRTLGIVSVRAGLTFCF